MKEKISFIFLIMILGIISSCGTHKMMNKSRAKQNELVYERGCFSICSDPRNHFYFFYFGFDKSMEKEIMTSYSLMTNLGLVNGNCFEMQYSPEDLPENVESYLWSYFLYKNNSHIRIYYVDKEGRYCSILCHYEGNLDWLNEIEEVSGDFPIPEYEKDESTLSNRHEAFVNIRFIRFKNKYEDFDNFWEPMSGYLESNSPEFVKQYVRDYKRYVEPFIKMKKVIATDETLQTVERK